MSDLSHLLPNDNETRLFRELQRQANFYRDAACDALDALRVLVASCEALQRAGAAMPDTTAAREVIGKLFGDVATTDRACRFLAREEARK